MACKCRKACKRYRWPIVTVGGRTWRGPVWIGRPRPTRWWAEEFHEEHPHPDRFCGCGCIAALKERWERLAAWWQSELASDQPGRTRA